MEKLAFSACPKCNDERFVVVINASKVGGEITLIQPQRDAGFFGGKNTSPLQVVTCGTCGYTEFYASEPQKLLPNSI